MKLEIGQTIYLNPINNEARYNRNIKQVKIIKIGRKYFEVTDCRDRLNIETMLSDNGEYAPCFKAYLSLEQIENENKKHHLFDKFRKLFQYQNKFSLEQLEKIDKIIQE